MKVRLLLSVFLLMCCLFQAKLYGQCTASITASATSVCSGQQVILLAFTQNCGSNIQFQWNTGQNTQSITVNPIDTLPTTVSITYTVTVTSSNGTAVASKQVIVKPYPEVIITNNKPFVCHRDSSNIILSSTTPGASFSWLATDSNLTGAVNGSGIQIVQVLSNLNDSNGIATYSVTPTYSGCVGNPQSTTVTLHQRPQVVVTNYTDTICGNQQTDIQLSSNFPESSFQWTANTFDVSGATSGSDSLIGDILSSTVNGTGTVIYEIAASHMGCVGDSVQTTVIVKPLPTLFFSQTNPQICNGDSVIIALSSLLPDVIFDWTVFASGVTGANNGSGDTISQVLTADNPPSNVTYSVTATLDGCQADPLWNTAFIKPIPTATYLPLAPIICSGSSANVYLSSTPSGATFEWYPLASNIIGASNGNGNGINQILTVAGNNPDSVTYIVTADLNGCLSLPEQVSVSVKPVPGVSVNPDSSTICSGNATNILLTSNPAGAFLSWTTLSNNVNGYFNGAGNSITQILSTTSASGWVTYTITPVLNQCQGASADATVIVNACLGTGVFQESENFLYLSPNPSTQESRLSLPVIKPGKVIIEIYNDLGKKIFASVSEQQGSFFTSSINTSSFKSGVYMVVVSVAEARFNKRLVVIN